MPEKKTPKEGLKAKKERVQHAFADMLEIPEETLLNLPKIIMVGGIQLYIENHCGVIEYTSQILRVGTSIGELVVKGEELHLRNILPDELSLDGKIYSVEFNE